MVEKNVGGLKWTAWSTDQKSLIYQYPTDFSAYTSYRFQPNGQYGTQGIVVATGLVIDNLSNPATITVTTGGFVENIPPYTKSVVNFTPGQPDVILTSSSNQVVLLATFYYGQYPGALGASNLLGATTQANQLALAGEIKAFAGPAGNIPSGYLFCDGAAISRTAYATLFSVIGTTWGAGDGATTFNIPDLRGLVLVCASPTYVIGSKGGESTHVLTTAEIPAHAHGYTDPAHNHAHNDPAHSHVVNDPTHQHISNFTANTNVGSGNWVATSSQTGVYNNAGYTAFASTGITIANAYTNITNSANYIGITITNTGGGGAHNNMQPYATVVYMIKT